MAFLSRLDWLGRIRGIDLHAPEAKVEFPDLDLDRGGMELLVRTHKGDWFGGFDGFRLLASHIPVFWLILPLLYLPPIPALGRWAYKRIAARRYCLLPNRNTVAAR